MSGVTKVSLAICGLTLFLIFTNNLTVALITAIIGSMIYFFLGVLHPDQSNANMILLKSLIGLSYFAWILLIIVSFPAFHYGIMLSLIALVVAYVIKFLTNLLVESNENHGCSHIFIKPSYLALAINIFIVLLTYATAGII